MVAHDDIRTSRIGREVVNHDSVIVMHFHNLAASNAHKYAVLVDHGFSDAVAELHLHEGEWTFMHFDLDSAIVVLGYLIGCRSLRLFAFLENKNVLEVAWAAVDAT